jgi:hypothetical protein
MVDIQEDFQITINSGYPFMKKFPIQPDIDPREYIRRSLVTMSDFRNLSDDKYSLSFILDIGDVITISPIFQTGSQERGYSDPDKAAFFRDYISNQLNNSGILDALRDVPTMNNGRNSNKIVITLKGFYSSLGSNMYHYDSSLFTILQYFNNSEDPFVLGTEILLGYENPLAVEHGETVKQNGEDVYPENVTGRLISENFNMIKSSNRSLKAQNFHQILLRGLYRPGDTLVLTNTLYRHGVIDPNEKFKEDDSNIMKITVDADPVGSSITTPDTVKICSHRIKTSNEHKRNRQLLVMFIDTVSVSRISSTFKIGPSAPLITTPVIPVKSVNFNAEQYEGFIKALSLVDESCVSIGMASSMPIPSPSDSVLRAASGPGAIDFYNRGGKKIKKQSNKKRKSNIFKTRKQKKITKRRYRRRLFIPLNM